MTDIDREVTERVMGWHHTDLLNDDPFTPSTRIDHAWEVVDHLKNTRRYLSVFSFNWSDGKGWWCNLYPHIGPYIETDYYETAPLAICRAALQAVKDQPQ